MYYYVTKRPQEKPVLHEMEGRKVGYETLREGVGGYIECVRKEIGGDEVDVWVNEEGLLLGLEPNYWDEELGQPLNGPVIVCRADKDGDSIGLTKAQAEKVMKYLASKGNIAIVGNVMMIDVTNG